MKINSYPKDLDLIIKFENCDLIFSENPNYNTKIIKHNTKPQGFYFVLSKLESTKKATVTIYKFSAKENEGNITIKNTISIISTEKGLLFELDNKKVDIGKLKNISKFISEEDTDFEKVIASLSFNSHCKRLGFNDIFFNLRNCYNKYHYNDTYNCILYYYYYSTPEMYAIAERLIKLGMISDIDKYNPVISGKPIPDVSTINMFSKISMDIIKKYKRRNDDLIELFSQLENNPKIGVNGIKMIDEMIELYNQIYIPYSSNCDSFGIRWNEIEIFAGFDIITKQFNITTKNLINRIIKASFTENLSVSNYIQLVTDYIRIADMLHLPIPTKMPKDIVKDHDLMAAQYEYIKDKVIETEFKNKVKQNKLLLNTLPENKNYTIISPETPNDLIEEGLNMKHCVGTYVTRYADGISKIFFVRNKCNPDFSCVTLELNRNNKLIQARSFANSNPSKEILDFIDEWLETLR